MGRIETAVFADETDPAIVFDSALAQAELHEALDEAERTDGDFEADVRALALGMGPGTSRRAAAA